MILVIDDGIIGMPRCIRGWIYSFESFFWTFLAECIYEIIALRMVTFLSLDGDVTLTLNQLEGTSYIDKNQVLQIVVMYNMGRLSDFGMDPVVDIVLINGKTLTSTRVNHSFKCTYYTNNRYNPLRK